MFERVCVRARVCSLYRLHFAWFRREERIQKSEFWVRSGNIEGGGREVGRERVRGKEGFVGWRKGTGREGFGLGDFFFPPSKETEMAASTGTGVGGGGGTGTGGTRKFKLQKESELRVEVGMDSPLKLQLVIGTAEVFGTELPPMFWMTFPAAHKFAVSYLLNFPESPVTCLKIRLSTLECALNKCSEILG